MSGLIRSPVGRCDTAPTDAEALSRTRRRGPEDRRRASRQTCQIQPMSEGNIRSSGMWCLRMWCLIIIDLT